MASQLQIFNKQDYFKGMKLNSVLFSFRIKLNLFHKTVGNALVMLLQNADLLPSPSQRLAAVLLLHELFKTQDSQNFHPFSSVFANILVCIFLDQHKLNN